MARFVFKLEPLLRHRRHLEQQRQAEMAVVQRAVVEMEQSLRLLNDQMAQQLRDNPLTGRLDLAYLAAHRRFSQAMQRKGEGLLQEIAKKHVELERARVALAEAAKERKIVEKLREKHEEAWREDQSRREVAEMDEIGTRLSTDNLNDVDA